MVFCLFDWDYCHCLCPALWVTQGLSSLYCPLQRAVLKTQSVSLWKMNLKLIFIMSWSWNSAFYIRSLKANRNKHSCSETKSEKQRVLPVLCFSSLYTTLWLYLAQTKWSLGGVTFATVVWFKYAQVELVTPNLSFPLALMSC